VGPFAVECLLAVLTSLLCGVPIGMTLLINVPITTMITTLLIFNVHSIHEFKYVLYRSLTTHTSLALFPLTRRVTACLI
jgi:hypothetical protein